MTNKCIFSFRPKDINHQNFGDLWWWCREQTWPEYEEREPACLRCGFISLSRRKTHRLRFIKHAMLKSQEGEHLQRVSPHRDMYATLLIKVFLFDLFVDHSSVWFQQDYWVKQPDKPKDLLVLLFFFFAVSDSFNSEEIIFIMLLIWRLFDFWIDQKVQIEMVWGSCLKPVPKISFLLTIFVLVVYMYLMHNAGTIYILFCLFRIGYIKELQCIDMESEVGQIICLKWFDLSTPPHTSPYPLLPFHSYIFGLI